MVKLNGDSTFSMIMPMAMQILSGKLMKMSMWNYFGNDTGALYFIKIF